MFERLYNVMLKGFNPRPGADTGATPADLQRYRGHKVSIRAPVRTPGRHVGSVHISDPTGVSIRAPVRTPGRQTGWGSSWATLEFQSAPRCGHRGDFRCAAWFRSERCFNPRPGADTGATARPCYLQSSSTVSIRAPVRTPGRPRGRADVGRPWHVSIRAPVRTPGRQIINEFSLFPMPGFNPRPGADTGATPAFRRSVVWLECFNPRPGADTGATAPFLSRARARERVSIRAPVRTPGRPRPGA